MREAGGTVFAPARIPFLFLENLAEMSQRSERMRTRCARRMCYGRERSQLTSFTSGAVAASQAAAPQGNRTSERKPAEGILQKGKFSNVVASVKASRKKLVFRRRRGCSRQIFCKQDSIFRAECCLRQGLVFMFGWEARPDTLARG